MLDFIFNPTGMPSSVPKSPMPPGFDAKRPESEISQVASSEFEITEAARELQVEGVRLAQKGDVELAIEEFTQALELDANNPMLLNDRAQAYRDVGYFAESQADIDLAIDTMNAKHGGETSAWPL